MGISGFFFFSFWIRENLCDELIFTAVPTSRLSTTFWIFYWNIHLLHFYVVDWTLPCLLFFFLSAYIYWCLQKSAGIWLFSVKMHSWSLISGVLLPLSDSTVSPQTVPSRLPNGDESESLPPRREWSPSENLSSLWCLPEVHLHTLPFGVNGDGEFQRDQVRWFGCV